MQNIDPEDNVGNESREMTRKRFRVKNIEAGTLSPDEHAYMFVGAMRDYVGKVLTFYSHSDVRDCWMQITPEDAFFCWNYHISWLEPV